MRTRKCFNAEVAEVSQWAQRFRRACQPPSLATNFVRRAFARQIRLEERASLDAAQNFPCDPCVSSATFRLRRGYGGRGLCSDPLKLERRRAALKNSFCFAAVAVYLAGCSSVEPKAVDVRMQCIPMTTWTGAQQDEMRKEYDALPKDAILRGVFMDWVAMRDATRACEGDHHGGT